MSDITREQLAEWERMAGEATPGPWQVHRCGYHDEYGEGEACGVCHALFLVEPTGEEGIHTGRPRYRVTCQQCGALVHEATTGPGSMAAMHLREGCKPGGSP